MEYTSYGPFIPVIMIITFLGLFVWVLLPQNKKSFDAAAQLPFDDEEADSLENYTSNSTTKHTSANQAPRSKGRSSL